MLNALGLAGLVRRRLLDLAYQWLAGLIRADDPVLGIMRTGVDLQHAFHAIHESDLPLGQSAGIGSVVWIRVSNHS